MVGQAQSVMKTGVNGSDACCCHRCGMCTLVDLSFFRTDPRQGHPTHRAASCECTVFVTYVTLFSRYIQRRCD